MSTIRKLLIKNGELCARSLPLKAFITTFRTEKLKTNPAALVQLPKLHEKEIIRLDIDEVALLLDAVEQGDGLTDKQKAFHNRTKLRDLALLTLLLEPASVFLNV